MSNRLPTGDPGLAADALDVPLAHAGEAAGNVRERLAGVRFDSVAAVVVVSDEGIVAGVVRPEDLLAAPRDAAIRQLMDEGAPLVHTGDDEVASAWEAVGRAESSLVMVDEAGRLLGSSRRSG